MKERNEVFIEWWLNASKFSMSIALLTPVAYATPMIESSGVLTPIIWSAFYLAISVITHFKAASFCDK